MENDVVDVAALFFNFLGVKRFLYFLDSSSIFKLIHVYSHSEHRFEKSCFLSWSNLESQDKNGEAFVCSCLTWAIGNAT